MLELGYWAGRAPSLTQYGNSYVSVTTALPSKEEESLSLN